MRVIIRFSVNGETNGAVRNLLAWNLNNVDIERTGTGTWEHPNILPANFAFAMSKFWEIVANPVSVPNAQEGVSIDHVWVYADSLDSTSVTSLRRARIL